MVHILIIDDEKEIGNFLRHLFELKGYQVTVGYSGKDFEKIIRTKSVFQLAMIDLKLPDTTGLDILRTLKSTQPQCKTIIMTGYSTIQTAVDAIKMGAHDYIEKPFDDLDGLEQLIDQHLMMKMDVQDTLIYEAAIEVGLVIGPNKEMENLLKTAYKVASKNVNVLIEGETGTGKEVLAHFLHKASQRKNERFLGINCGAISETLLESELFGHEKGAFTGATQMRKGLFELATKGTLFLDEIGEASHPIQVKLLRVLETREFMRLGSEHTFKTNARIVAATNVNLEEAVLQKKFREDLLYRLNVVTFRIPPLRERVDDIPTLLTAFIEEHSSKSLQFSDEAVRMLQNYPWPGNLREFYNVLTRTFMLANPNETIISASDLKFSQVNAVASSTHSKINGLAHKNESGYHEIDQILKNCIQTIIQNTNGTDTIIDLDKILSQLKDFEKELVRAFIKEKLKETIGNRRETAKRLKITDRKLRYLLNEK